MGKRESTSAPIPREKSHREKRKENREKLKALEESEAGLGGSKGPSSTSTTLLPDIHKPATNRLDSGSSRDGEKRGRQDPALTQSRRRREARELSDKCDKSEKKEAAKMLKDGFLAPRQGRGRRHSADASSLPDVHRDDGVDGCEDKANHTTQSARSLALNPEP